MSMNVGIVGSRKYTNYEKIKEEVLKIVPLEKIRRIISGGAQGVDTLAEQLAKEYNIPTIVYYPEWSKYGKSAGPKRNTLIVDNSDMIIAFPDNDSIGTYDTIHKGEKKGIPVHIIKV